MKSFYIETNKKIIIVEIQFNSRMTTVDDYDYHYNSADGSTI